jgi:nucleoside-diphosphate-sugar epimerase
MKNVCIFGCGWLGKSIAKVLLNNGYTVYGSTRKSERFDELKKLGIQPFLFNSSDDFLPKFIPQSSSFLILLPPGRTENSAESYAHLIQTICSQIHERNPSKIIFTSSTSIYPKSNGVWTEDAIIDEMSTGSEVLLLGERHVLNTTTLNKYILRLGGLCDFDRNPFTWNRANSTTLLGGEPINMVHRADVISVLLNCLENKIASGIWNVCSDEHPSRKAFYSSVFQAFGANPPTFEEPTKIEIQRIISNLKLKEKAGYEFQFPDPLTFFK